MNHSGKALPKHELGWKYDLPTLNEIPKLPPETEKITPPPNHCDDIYLEFARSTFSTRGIILIISLTGLIFLGVMIFFMLSTTVKLGVSDSWDILLTALLATPVALAFMLYFARLDLALPRDEPVRFNRARKRVYFYHYTSDAIRVLSRKHWKVEPIAHNWEDITAEVYSGYGGAIEHVMLSVRAPQSDNVIDRFIFAHSLTQGKQYWALACLFMQQGPEALPDFSYAPYDWNDEQYLNPIHRLAPKVQWPIEMDLESRTAPSPGEHP
ncbi:DUF6708 domain-containing protein [Pseudomonas sp. PSKL.D1]|uniref:DUF6708 domain-containing protein n=1 Tax=Pseudomonas sp. PSKL.D1 TaxID=3029060 RepID=UPI0023815707|nr:DUF6708 domain-containing protein [Pseudomonas sp. PSKL.D1]WDY56305.1 hypothetical protein PVV54_17055 [Pseudomonas sp. PSKL.D1]